MPIIIWNGLPAILIPVAGMELLALVDTCAAVSIGNYDNHKNWMHKYPTMVAKFREFNDSDPFEPIKLGGAIVDPFDYDETEVNEKYGALTAVVHYYTDLYFPDGNQLVLSFALGKDVAV